MNLPWTGDANQNQQLFDGLLSVLSDTAGLDVFLWNLETDECYASPSAVEKYGLPGAAFAAGEISWEALFYPPDYPAAHQRFAQLRRGEVQQLDFDCRLQSAKGAAAWASIRCKLVPGEDGKPLFLAGSVAEIGHAQRVDAMTGLRTQTQIGIDFKDGLPDGESGVLLFIGVDDLKAVNDRFGPRVGNRLLRQLAAAIEAKVPRGGRAYRLDGDRFAVFLPEKNKVAAARFYETLSEEFQRGCQALEKGLFCTISAGVATYPLDARELVPLVQFAESALNTAKAAGKNTLVYFSRDDYEQYLFNISMSEDLRHCIFNDFEGFELHFQPLVNVATGEVKGAEALLRWTSHEHGRVSPTVFIPLLEKIGLICKMGRWVIDRALEKCAEWRALLPGFSMSVNLSYIQFEKDDIAGYLLSALQQNNLPGSAVLLEITESEKLNNYGLYNEKMSYLNQLGAMVAIDDFGTGYSSLGYLKELHINQIKIDQCFVQRIRESDYDFNLIRFIIEMAHSIGMTVCVEGVETAEDLAVLLQLHPDFVQGYYFGRPVAAEAFEQRFIHGWQPSAEALRKMAETSERRLPDEFVAAGHQEFKDLLDELDVIVKICDIDTYEMLYLNRAGRSILNAEDYAGRTCYDVMHGRSERCADCPQDLSMDRFHEWSYVDARTGTGFTVKDKLILWEGKPARLGVSLSDQDAGGIGQVARKRLEVENIIVSCVRTLMGEDGVVLEDSIRRVLKTIGNYHEADRVYIFEFEDEGRVARNTYEWCAAGVDPEKDLFASVNFADVTPRWYGRLEENKPLFVEGPEQLREAFPEEYPHLALLGSRSFSVAPFFLNGRVTGFVGMDNPRRARKDTQLLSSLSYFISSAITKRELERQLYRSSYYDELTGVYNRNKYLEDVAAHSGKSGALGVVFADINGLKALNDEHGHEFGDQLIRQAAEDLVASFDSDAVYRAGGDEFIVLCHGVAESELAARVEKLQERMAMRDYSISVGFTWTRGGADVEYLARQADSRMYRDKKDYYRSNTGEQQRRAYAQHPAAKPEK